jgi:predicted ATPase/DNA-binding SARP family transcriptional activator/Tfp pilus assembly protein PilF
MRPGALQHEPAAFTLRLFGAFDLQVEGQPTTSLRLRKDRWLLALLSLAHGRPVQRDWLAQTLWPFPDFLPSQAAYNLRRSLSALRKALDTQAGRLTSPTPHTLLLDLAGAQVDALAFDAALTRGDLSSLEQAVALYAGPLLSECTEVWALPEREARRQSYLQALERLAGQALARSDHVGAVRFLRLAVAVDALGESAQRALMEALAQGGEYAGAVQVYQGFAEALYREDPRALPSPQTQALYQRLRAESRRAVLPSRSERLVAAPGVTLPAASISIPHPITELVGREEAIVEVVMRLRQSRLVTLTGTGGVGKTRLAIAVAEAVQDNYRGGVWFAELAALADASGIPQAVASVLGVREEKGRTLEETLLGSLSCRVSLLVLDNCEHLVEGCGEFVKKLLEGCAGLRILTTSRQGLGVVGEVAWWVPSLAVPDPEVLPTDGEALVEAVCRYAGVELFVERAEAVQKTFVLTGKNAREVARICQRLDGIPLALQLAAARVQVLTVRQIAQRLDDCFRLLTGGSRTLPRHQTLRETMDWSYALLAEPEKILLGRLSVFAGGWTLEAAELVCAGEEREEGREESDSPSLAERSEGIQGVAGRGSDRSEPSPCSGAGGEGLLPCIEEREILDLLSSLVDKSLALVEERGDSVRYRLLETVRQYAAEKLRASGEEEALRDRYYEWCLGLVEEAEPNLTGSEQGRWLDRLEQDNDNLKAALAWRLANPEKSQERDACISAGAERTAEPHLLTPDTRPPSVLRFCSALQQFWMIRGYLAEGRARCEAALALESAQERTTGRARVLNGAGALSCYQGDDASARAYYEQSLAIFREIGDRRGIANALIGLGGVAHNRSDYASARAYYEQSLAIFREMGDRYGIAWSLNNLGNVAHNQGDYAAARAHHEQSLEIRREMGDLRSIAYSLNNLGCLARDQGDYAGARVYYEQSLPIFQEIGDRWGIAASLNNLGRVAHHQGDFTSARVYYEQGLPIFREIGDRRSMAYALNSLGNVTLYQGDDASARAYYEQSLVIYQEIGDPSGVARSHKNLGNVALYHGDYASARAYHEESLAIFQEIGDQWESAYALVGLGNVAYGQNDYAAARAYHEQCLAILRKTGDRYGMAASLNNLGDVAYHQSDYGAARAYYEESLAIFREIASKQGIAECLDGFAKLAFAQVQAGIVSTDATTATANIETGLRSAARLWGAAQALRDAIGAPILPEYQKEEARTVAMAREGLGEAEWEGAWAEGQAMTMDEAVTYALDHLT